MKQTKPKIDFRELARLEAQGNLNLLPETSAMAH